MKKIFTLLCVTLSSLATMANGVEVNGIYYLLDSNKMTASVTYRGTDQYSGNNYVGSIVIPDTIVYFENKYAVTSIGDLALFYCVGLTSITIGNSVTTIGHNAFEGCSDLTSVTIGNSVTTIGHYAFQLCTSLISVTIPNSVTMIGRGAFCSCSSLTSIAIPNSVTSIGQDAFSGSNLSSIAVASDNLIYDSRENCNAIIETATSTLIAGCQNTIIPNSVITIGDNAFYGCDSLTSITIPISVTTIGERAFYNCKGLTSVAIPCSVITIGDNAFYGCSGLTSVTIPNSVTTIENRTFAYCTGLTSVTIPNSVTTIGSSAFDGCSGLTSVTIGNSVTTIGNSAFYGCSGLTSVTIGNSVTTIGNYAFYNCSGLTSVTIPNSVTTIEDCAFERCSGLTSVTIGNSVTTIGYHAFYYCSGLTSITCLAINPPSMGNDVFYKVSRDIPLYVYASSVPAYQAAAQWNEFDIHWIVVDSITPDTTQLSWLPVDSASLYKLRIYSEQIELDTTLLIEADSLNGGISIPITLAPQRDRRMPMDDIGSVVIITLEPNSGATKETPFRVTVSTTSKDKIDILFDMDVQKGEKVFREESGSFTLNNIPAIVTGLDKTMPSKWGCISGIYDLYGHRYMPNQWNTLPAGIYILRDGEKASKMMKQ